MTKAKRAHYATIASEAERTENAKLLKKIEESQKAKLQEDQIDKTVDKYMAYFADSIEVAIEVRPAHY